MMVLSVLVRDMVAAEWELDILKIGVGDAQPPGSLYMTQRCGQGHHWEKGEGNAVGFLSFPVTAGGQGLVGLMAEGLSLWLPLQSHSQSRSQGDRGPGLAKGPCVHPAQGPASITIVPDLPVPLREG